MKEIWKEPLSKNVMETPKESKETPKEESEYSNTTLFVSTLPFDATKEELEEFFSSVGPIRSCFIIKKEGKSTGCGYVQFALPEDCTTALGLKKKIFKTRTLKIVRAFRKKVVDERRESGIPMQDKELLKIKEKVKVVAKGPGQAPNPTVRLSKSVTIQLSKLPIVSKKVLFKKVKKFGTVAELVLDEDSNTAKVVYSTAQEAQNAIKHLHDHTYKSVKIEAKIVETITPESIAKRNRLIIRNLSFQCKKDNLEKVFGVFGEIGDVQVPQTTDGKARGFGFVQFKELESAEKAVVGVNGQKILGRVVAVDWALGKSEYDRLKTESERAAAAEVVDGDAVAEDSVEDAVPDDSSEAVKEDAESNSESGEKESDSVKEDESDVSNESESKSVAVGSESGSESETEELKEEDPDAAIIYESDGAESEQEEVPVREREEVPEDCTIFVRNLSYETTKETLHKLFASWGALRYAVVTKDKTTGLSKGNGFVAFQKIEDAERCLKEFEEASMHAQINGLVSGDVVRDAKEKPKKSILAPLLPEAIPEATQKFHVDGRFISITPAVSKQIATKLTQASNLNKRAQDKRHLYLMREGVVFPGTEAAEQLTPEEVEARMATFAARKRLLATNPNLFVSRTRLSVRGLHPKLTDAQLKAAARIAVNGFWEDVANGLRKPMEEEVVQEEQEMGLGVPGPKRKIFITQAKIIKDMDRLDPVTKKPKSKGYGFIEFKSHADSLACLRYMNNNVEAFAKAMGQEYNNGKKKNPSVEFAVENNLVLKKRKEREIRGEKRKGEDKNGDDKKRKVDSGDRDRGKKGEKKVQDLKSRGPAKSTDRDSKDLKSTRPPFKSNDRDTRSPRAPFKSNDRDAKDSRAPRHPFKSNDRKPERKYSDTFLKNRKDTGKVSKKSTSTTPEKLPKRQFKREQKAKEESKFESLVTNFKKKLIDNATMTKSATSKWYA